MARHDLAFGRFRLQPGRQLLSDGEPVVLGAKPLNILSTLVEAGGDLVTKDELIERTWPGLVVEENTLQAHISAIRRVLGEDGRWIATVPGRGYRFAGPLAGAVDALSKAEPPQPAPPPVATPMPVTAPRREKRERRLAIAAAGGFLLVAAGLAWWWGQPGSSRTVQAERYLVLPFVNRTGNPHNEDFTDSLSDAVAGRIAAQSWDSEVIGHNKAFSYKGQAINEARLAEQLDLTYIVEGSLFPGAAGLEASAVIVDARTGAQIATVSAEAQKADAATERQFLAAGLADQVRSTIYRQAQHRIAAEKPDDGDIRNLLVRAERAMDEQSPGSSWPVAAPLIDKALALDPRNVHALSVAAAIRIQFVEGFACRDEAQRTAMLNEAEAALLEAGRIDPTRTTVHLMLGDLQSAQGRHDAARAEYQRVLDLDPANAFGLDGLAMEDIYAGQPEAAMPRLERAKLISPDDAYLIDGDVALMRLNLGQDDAALAAIRQAVTVDATDPWVWINLTGLLQLTGHRDEAQAALKTLRRLVPGLTIARLRLADINTSEQYRRSQERIYAALKEAGLQEADLEAGTH
jgi:DNA-binding winged helix-turn-helix (wHTH) protein/TolB-like protein/Flp pilus assembly protein TadD